MKLLICGTQKKIKGYKELVFKTLDNYCSLIHSSKYPDAKPSIIEGACPDSADIYAREWAYEKTGVHIKEFPATKGNYLKRNIDMINEKPDLVIAFWDGYSYGTAHTIAQAILKGISVAVIELR